MKDIMYNRKKILGFILFFMALGLLIYMIYSLISSSHKLLVCQTRQLYIDDEVTVRYEDDNIKDIAYKMTYDLSSMPDETYHDLKEDIKKNIHLCKDYNHVGNDFIVESCKQEIDGEVITADLVLKARDVTYLKLDELKQYFEELNYTCKVGKPQ